MKWSNWLLHNVHTAKIVMQCYCFSTVPVNVIYPYQYIFCWMYYLESHELYQPPACFNGNCVHVTVPFRIANYLLNANIGIHCYIFLCCNFLYLCFYCIPIDLSSKCTYIMFGISFELLVKYYIFTVYVALLIEPSQVFKWNEIADRGPTATFRILQNLKLLFYFTPACIISRYLVLVSSHGISWNYMTCIYCSLFSMRTFKYIIVVFSCCFSYWTEVLHIWYIYFSSFLLTLYELKMFS